MTRHVRSFLFTRVLGAAAVVLCAAAAADHLRHHGTPEHLRYLEQRAEGWR